MAMALHTDTLRLQLSRGPAPARQLIEKTGLSQPTLSRALAALGAEVVRIGAARSIQYALRDNARGLPEMPIYRVDAEGRVARLGMLIPVRPAGFVMHGEDGRALHSDSLPWWLFDMRPQGYVGRAYAARHSAELGLPARITDWNDSHVLRALLQHGHDASGNLLLGDSARDHFLAAPLPRPLAEENKAAKYAQLAQAAAHGEMPGSSAGGEQPKFTTFATTSSGTRHVIVKFSEAEAGPVSERWRDLLLAEHIALTTLRDNGIPAASTHVLDHHTQRFLEVERFDRVGDLGRRALISLAALDAEFVGAGSDAWPLIAQQLAAEGHIRREALDSINLLWAFGRLIGNTDMHSGNLSFMAEYGRPYELAPAYDMSPMAFAPRSGGGLPDTLPPANIEAVVANNTWRQAEDLARRYLERLHAETRFSTRFRPCIANLAQHIEVAEEKIVRLG